jgi:predicted permease
MQFERWFQAMRMRLRALFRREAADRELDDELAYHVERKTEENVARGMSATEARRAALVDAGGIELAKENCRQTRGVNWIYDFGRDVRFGLRAMAKNPGFTAVAVLTLALGIGANTAIFSVINAMLLKALPVKEPNQLVVLNWAAHGWPSETLIYNAAGSWTEDKSGRLTCTSFPYFVYEQIAVQNRVFSGVAAESGNGSQLSVGYGGRPGRADGEFVSGSYFETLGVRAAAGRTFDESDDRLEASPQAVLGYGYWQQRFGGDTGIVGRTIGVNGVPVTVAGVSQPGFFGMQPGRSVDVWLPLHAQPQIEPSSPPPPPGKDAGSPWMFVGHDTWWLVVIGRLRPDLSEQQAAAGLEVIFQQSIASDVKPGDPADKIPHLGVQPGGRGLDDSRRAFVTPLFVLMAVVGLVLLIACINIANLLLARGTARQREIAVRLAVGARRGRLVRQLLTESVMLAGIGAVAGLLLAFWGTRILLALIGSGGTAVALDVSPDPRVLGFTAGLALLAGVLFGLSPALRATRVDLTPSLKESSADAFGAARGRGKRLRLGGALVIAQVSLSLVLLLGAGLFIRTLVNLEKANTGFDTRNLLLFGIDGAQAGYTGERLAQFYQELERRLAALPGVRSVGTSHSTLIGGGGNFQLMQIPGYVPKAGENEGAAINWVGPNFFRAMGIPFALGRDIAESDTSEAPRVVVVNERFVRQFFGGVNPIGRHVVLGKKNDVEIVGVVSDAKYFDLRNEPPATIYPPWMQDSGLAALHFEVRTAGDPRGFAAAAMRTAQEMDRSLTLYDVKSQVEQIDQSLFQERLFAELTSFFGALAALLASVGLYGVMAFGVSRRTREIGVRMALGASRGEIVGMVVRETFVLVAIGLAIGVAAALGASRLIVSFLYGVRPSDPYTCAAVCAVLACVALAACVVPARRAMRVDPMVALRHE